MDFNRDQSDMKHSFLALWALFFGAIGIGFAAIFVRLSEVGSVATAFWRMGLAYPFLFVLMHAERRKKHDLRVPSSFEAYRRLVLPGIFFSADLIAWHISIRYTTVANATLLANFMPIFVTIFSFFIFKQRFGKLFLVGLVLALSGAVFLVRANIGLEGEYLLGDSLGLLTAVFYASYLLSVKGLRNDFSTSTIMTWNALTICIIVAPISIVSGETFFPGSLKGWMPLAAYALISQIGGQVIIAYALRHLSAAFSAVSLLMQPVVAAVAAWIIFSESLGIIQITGGVLVLMGIYLARRGSRAF